ncbi:MAG: hypothetical protein R3F29_05025 [Planctomycetota bacterium]
MSKHLALASLLATVLAGGGFAQDEGDYPMSPIQEPQVQNPFKPFDRVRFEAAARELGASDEQLATFGTEFDELGAARAADNLLRNAVPAFGKAVAAAEDSDPSAALALTRVLADTDSRLLQAHTRYHLARLFLDSDDPERAKEVLDDYIGENINVSPLDGEAAYFYAQSLAEVPLIDYAIPRFRAFLQWFPEASERFRAAAHQRVLELERQQQSRLHQLADGMKKTTRDLKKERTGEPVQVDQESYLEQLDELIKEFEEKESQSSGPASGLGPSNSPAASSALPGGESTVGNLNKRPSLADRWGDMKDSEREKIMADVQNTMPPQYQKMLEEYYKKLGKADRQ